jgi:hypothetical protein
MVPYVVVYTMMPSDLVDTYYAKLVEAYSYLQTHQN